MPLRSIFQSLFTPRSELNEVAAKRLVWSSLAIGAGGFYWRTLNVSERILPPHLFDFTFTVVNAGVALLYLGLISVFIQGAFYLCGHAVKNKLPSIYLLWGWTEIPKLMLILGVFYLNYFVPGFLLNVFVNWVWMIIAGSIALIFLIWYFSFKIQALKICYGISGKKLIPPASLMVIFYVILNLILMNTLEETACVRLADLKPMLPTLDIKLSSKTLLLNPYIRIPTIPVHDPNYKFQRGDVVTYVRSSKGNKISFLQSLFCKPRYLGRIVGLPGETVEIRKAWVMIDEKPLIEPYLKYSQSWDHSPHKISSQQFFVIGDNRLMTFGKYPGGVTDREDIKGICTAVDGIIFKLFEPEEAQKAFEFKDEKTLEKPEQQGKGP